LSKRSACAFAKSRNDVSNSDIFSVLFRFCPGGGIGVFARPVTPVSDVGVVVIGEISLRVSRELTLSESSSSFLQQ